MKSKNQKRRDPAELVKIFRQLDEASKNKPGMNNQEDIHECIAQLLRLIPVCPAVVASVLHGCFRQISGKGCVVDHKCNQEG